MEEVLNMVMVKRTEREIRRSLKHRYRLITFQMGLGFWNILSGQDP